MQAPRKSRRWLLLLLLSAGVAVSAEPAAACTLAPVDPRDQFADADAAFIGVLVDKEPVSSPQGPPEPGGPSVFTFEVSEVLKGDLGEFVEVIASDNGAACGLEIPEGATTGLLLHWSGGAWSASLGDEMTPEELRHAASPLPRPNGVGAVRLLVGGSVGHARTLALDAHARTLAYGFRDGVTEGFAVCPRARRVAEVAQLGRRTWLVVRNLPSLRIVRRVNIGLRGEYVAALACSDARARLILALVAKDYQALSRIVEVRGREASTIHRGHARAGAFAGRRAYLVGGRGLLSVDLRTGDADRVATEFRLVGAPAVSPSGSRLAARTPRRLVLFELEATGPRVVATRLLRRSPDASLVWGGNHRLALLRAPYESERSLVFDASLRVVGSFGGWSAHSTVGVGGRLYGLDYGYLIAARLPNGPVRVVRTFGSPETYALAAVPR